MKHLKRMIALAVAAMLVFAMGITAFAAKNDSITINNAKPGETYKLYKMFDLVVDSEEDPGAYSYTVNSDWTAFFTGSGAGAAYVTINDEGYVTEISDAAALAKAAANWSGKPSTPLQSVTVAEGASKAEFTGLDDGYYLITSTLGTIAMAETTPDKAAVTIDEKNPEDRIIKEVKEDSTGAYGVSNDAQIGDTIDFKSTATILPHSINVKIHDTMDSGLTFTTGSIKIYTDADMTTELPAADYEILATPDTGDTFTISIKDAYVDALTESTNLYIAYKAVLNTGAVSATPAIVDQKNTTKITFGDKQSVTAETTTTTHKFNIFKHASGKDTNLAGAVFSLKKGDDVINLTKIDDTNYKVDPNGTVTQFTTVASGDIVIWGVDADNDYKLTEITPPKGYNKISGDITVTVNADNSTRVDIENKAGSELPSTGGIGTTIFMVVGGIIVAGAIVLLIARKRVNANK